MTEVRGIEIETQHINFAATLVAYGCHLRSISADPETTPPRCTFRIMWTREPLLSLATVPSEILADVHLDLDRLIAKLDQENERVRSADLAAAKELLIDDLDLERTAQAFTSLWRAKRLRVEPQQFDRARRIVTTKMRDAQNEVSGG